MEEHIYNYIEDGTDIISVGRRREVSSKKVNKHHCFFTRDEDDLKDDNNNDVIFYNFALSNGVELFQKRDNVFYTAITLDSVRQTFYKNKVSFMSINVENTLSVIQGSQLFLGEHKPTLYIEISEEDLLGTQRFLNRLNYVMLERVGSSSYLFYYM
jgi:hypothetical protein